MNFLNVLEEEKKKRRKKLIIELNIGGLYFLFYFWVKSGKNTFRN